MFERFTDRARRAVVLAQEEARQLNHNYIGSEHLLLGLVHEGEGIAARALKSFGVTLEAARQTVEEIIGQGQDAPSGHIPFTPRAKKAMEFALREALQLGHNYIGTEHVLLAMIREGEGVGAQALAKLGVPELNEVRKRVLELVGQQTEEPKRPTTVRVLSPKSTQLNELLCTRVAEWLGSMDVEEFEDVVTERVVSGQPVGELTETLTIRWRRR